MDKGDILINAILIVIPVVGAVSAIGVEKAVTKFGHTFGPKSLLLIGLIGAVQNAVSQFFMASYIENITDEKRQFSFALLSHVITGVAIAGLTACAAKLNLISARITVIATIALVASSIVENFTILAVAGIISEIIE